MPSWPWLIASIVIHLFYFAGLIESYRAGDLGQVYPIARGAAPLMTATMTTIFVGERLGLYGWGGIVMLAAGVLLLSLRGGRDLAKLDRVAVGFALFTAVTVCAYSVVDGIGARAAGPGTATAYSPCCSSASRRWWWPMRWSGAARRCCRRWRRSGRSGSAAARSP